jgi:hypothetical protein
MLLPIPVLSDQRAKGESDGSQKINFKCNKNKSYTILYGASSVLSCLLIKFSIVWAYSGNIIENDFIQIKPCPCCVSELRI